MVFQPAPALCSRHRHRDHGFDSVQTCTPKPDKALVYREPQFSHDPKLVGEYEVVEADVDGAFDRVLQGDKPRIGLAGTDGIEHVTEAAEGETPSLGQVGLVEQRLLGKGPRRAEVGDARRGRYLHRTSLMGRRLRPATGAQEEVTRSCQAIAARASPDGRSSREARMSTTDSTMAKARTEALTTKPVT